MKNYKGLTITATRLTTLLVEYLKGERPFSITAGKCKYRMADGRTCVIGAFITDELYSRDIEHENGDVVVRTLKIPCQVSSTMVHKAQRVHDTAAALTTGRYSTAALTTGRYSTKFYALAAFVLAVDDFASSLPTHLARRLRTAASHLGYSPPSS